MSLNDVLGKSDSVPNAREEQGFTQSQTNFLQNSVSVPPGQRFLLRDSAEMSTYGQVMLPDRWPAKIAAVRRKRLLTKPQSKLPINVVDSSESPRSRQQ